MSEEGNVDYTQQIEEELKQAQKERRDIAKAQLGLYETSTEDNLVKWQLDLEKEKNVIEHMLKGHLKSTNDRGEEIWVEPSIKVVANKEVDDEGNFWFTDKKGKVLKIINKEDGSEIDCSDSDMLIDKPATEFMGYARINVVDYYNKPLNDHGVNMIMGYLDSFVNRNIILSDFDLLRVNEICYTIGNQINEDIFNDYEDIGMDSDGKRKKYPMIVLKVLINIEAALRRAMNGGERRTLRQIMTINQTDNPSRYQNIPMMQPSRSKRTLNPMTWMN